MEPLASPFKFQVGDIVTTDEEITMVKARVSALPIPYRVIGRSLKEAGGRLHPVYDLADDAGVKREADLPECEVVAIPYLRVNMGDVIVGLRRALLETLAQASPKVAQGECPTPEQQEAA